LALVSSPIIIVIAVQGCRERVVLTTDGFDEVVRRRTFVVAPAHADGLAP
jgi:hypothetical protein